jgi:hypothetical protein
MKITDYGFSVNAFRQIYFIQIRRFCPPTFLICSSRKVESACQYVDTSVRRLVRQSIVVSYRVECKDEW